MSLPDALPADDRGAAAVVGQVRARLDGLAIRSVNEHVEVFDGVHRLLQDSLATLDGA